MDKIKIKLTHGGKIERNNKFDSGFDVFAMGIRYVEPLESKLMDELWYDKMSQTGSVIQSNETALILTGVQIKLPEPIKVEGGYKALEIQVRGRSGMSLKSNTTVKLGTGDNQYTGVYGIIFKNDSDENYVVNQGDKIAQLVFNEVFIPDEDGFEIVDDFNEDSSRGDKGFGSSD